MNKGIFQQCQWCTSTNTKAEWRHELSPHPTTYFGWWERRIKGRGHTHRSDMQYVQTHPRGHTCYYLSWYVFWGPCLSSSSSSSVLLSTSSCLCFQIIPLCLSIDSRSPLPRSWFLYLCVPLPLFLHTFPPHTLTAQLSPSHGLGLASELTGNCESSHDNPNPGRACVCARTSVCVCFVFEMGVRGICVRVCVCFLSVWCSYFCCVSPAHKHTNTHTGTNKNKYTHQLEAAKVTEASDTHL